MTQLEQNNITTQLELCRDILSNYGSIIYEIEQKGKYIRELLATKKLDEKEKTVTLTKETFDLLLDSAYILQDKNKWEQLGILSKSYIPELEIKKKILNQLQSN